MCGRRVLLFFIMVAGCLTTELALATDWGAEIAPIEKIWIYPHAVIVLQGGTYAGAAGCNEDAKWSFYWADFSEDVAARIHSTLLAAYLSKTPFRAIFHDTECGPENRKKFIGSFEF